MMNLSRPSYAQQIGITLIEMVIGLFLIVLIIGATVSGFNHEAHRAELMQAQMQLVQAGIRRLQTDMPCGIKTLSGLVRREDALNGLCGDQNNLDNWRGPYTDSSSRYMADGSLDLTSIVPDASMVVYKKTVGADIYTILKLNNISNEFRSAILVRCGDDCLPLKNLNNDILTVGSLVSKATLQVLSGQTSEVLPLPNVCRSAVAC